MKYSEYRVRESGLEKRLGVLGEIHIYNSEESQFAQEIVPTYDALGMEGSGKTSSISMIGVLHVIPMLTYMFATGRYKPTALQIAKKHGKEIIRLEENEGDTFSFTQKLALSATGIINSAMSPYAFFCFLKYGDPYVEGTEAYEKRQKILQKGRGWYARFNEWALKSNFPLRDSMMADNAAEIIRTRSNNLLVVCGQAHFDGVANNLQNKLDMVETASLEEASA